MPHIDDAELLTMSDEERSELIRKEVLATLANELSVEEILLDASEFLASVRALGVLPYEALKAELLRFQMIQNYILANSIREALAYKINDLPKEEIQAWLETDEAIEQIKDATELHKKAIKYLEKEINDNHNLVVLDIAFHDMVNVAVDNLNDEITISDFIKNVVEPMFENAKKESKEKDANIESDRTDFPKSGNRTRH